MAATVVGAVIGAVLCADRMPEGLDWIYRTVQAGSARPSATVETEPPDHIKKIVDKAESKSARPDVSLPPSDTYREGRTPGGRLALAGFGLILGAAVGSALGRLLERWLAGWDKMPLGERVTIIAGIFGGVLVTIPLASVVQAMTLPFAPFLIAAMMIGLSALCVYILQSIEEALPWWTAAGKRRKSGVKVLDTNVLIDGRVYDVIRAGFLEGDVYVPQFVIQELQHIADSADGNRRQRGRRGLDVLKRIQSERTVDVGSQDRFAGESREEVDARLVKLTKALGGDLVTNDHNLNKVAQINDVRVLNINDLVVSLKPTVLPGEPLDITVLREGNQPGQGVGYLDDGTMVVVEHASQLVGELVRVEVTQVIQTERGKMIFADSGQGDGEGNGNGFSRRPRPRAP